MLRIGQCEICEKGMCQVCTRQCILCDQLRCSKCCLETYLLHRYDDADGSGEDREPVCLECIAELKKQENQENEMEQNAV